MTVCFPNDCGLPCHTQGLINSVCHRHETEPRSCLLLLRWCLGLQADRHATSRFTRTLKTTPGHNKQYENIASEQKTSATLAWSWQLTSPVRLELFCVLLCAICAAKRGELGREAVQSRGRTVVTAWLVSRRIFQHGALVTLDIAFRRLQSIQHG